MSWISRLDDTQFQRLERCDAILERHGFCIGSEPIEGQEEQFLAVVEEGARCVLKLADTMRTIYGYRGMSARLLAHLHTRAADLWHYNIALRPSPSA